ncbi:MAG TPA: sulfotransferase, partial [Chloroflexota bacterium]|nr:sulfotransferase [Chloroflexota bacterium]
MWFSCVVVGGSDMLKVMGAGFARTGTTSVMAALDQLGYSPSYHMSTIFAPPEHIALTICNSRKGRHDAQRNLVVSPWSGPTSSGAPARRLQPRSHKRGGSRAVQC